MKRSPMKPSTAILKRTAFMRTVRKEKAAVSKLRNGLRSKGPRMTPIRSSARGQECTLRFSCCNYDPTTTVWCHSNHYADGKGAGLKARDEEGCYGCSTCHAFLDGGYAGRMDRAEVDQRFDNARCISREILKVKGLIP